MGTDVEVFPMYALSICSGVLAKHDTLFGFLYLSIILLNVFK
jgi:hypothetical protein